MPRGREIAETRQAPRGCSGAGRSVESTLNQQDRMSAMGKNPRFRDLQVAIVDNDTPIAPVLRSTLGMWEITKSKVYNTNKEALIDIVQDRKPDIVLLNWCGSKNDPLQFAKIVRNPKNFPYPFLAMVILLSNVKRDKVLAARDAGVDEFLAIPFTPKNLYERILSVIQERRGFVDVPTYFGPDRRRGAMANYLGCERRSESILIDPEDGRTYISHADNRREYLQPDEAERLYLNI